MATRIKSLIITFAFASAVLATAGTLPVRPIGTSTDYVIDSSVWSNPSTDFATLYSEEIAVERAAWLRLYFGDVRLEGGSFVRMTSLLDGEQQALDASGLALWGNTSAYLNGGALLLELIAAPHTTNRVTLRQVAFEAAGEGGATRGEPGTCGICNGDDRAPSSQDWSCRLMPVGCSASVYTTGSCVVSAGHCAQPDLVAQFRVPDSLADCTVVNPPVADQFPVLEFDAQAGGLGADWSVMSTGPNNLGQRAFQRYGQLRRIAPGLASTGNPVSLWAYGMDNVCTRSRTQQLSPGVVNGRAASYYTFSADVHIGSSGGGVTRDGRIIAVVTHCSPTCPNAGTRVDQANFVAGRNNRCPPCVADVNGDDLIDLSDLASELSAFGMAYPDPAFNPAFDLNSDNTIDLSDLTLMLSVFGTNCP